MPQSRTAVTRAGRLGGQAVAALAQQPFVVALRLGRDGPEVGRELVTEADWVPMRSEVWMNALLRRGFPDFPFEDLVALARPVIPDGDTRCKQVTLLTVDPKGQALQVEFTIYAFEPVARRAMARLVKAGRLTVEETGQCFYNVALAGEDEARAGPAQAEPFQVAVRRQPLAYLERPMPPLLARAKAVGDVKDKACYPVFMTAEAYAKAERMARRGAAVNPPTESGAVLVGPLCSCPETGELFAVVYDALEVTDAEATYASLLYTGQTWRRIQTIMNARQQAPSSRGDRLLGEAHGHNFLPPHREDISCNECKERETCKMTSAFASSSDMVFHSSVFFKQPWQLCHIFGLDARGKGVHALFGQRDGGLLSRGFYIIPEWNGDRR
jgi:hypothetical protein